MGIEMVNKNSDACACAPSQHEARQVALNVGAQFAQSIASEIFKQTIVANAAGVAAILTYLSNRKVEDPILLICSAGFFLSGVAFGLLACLFTYTQTNSVLKKMMKAVTEGQGYKIGFVQKWMGRFGVWFCWFGVAAFVIAAVLAAIGLYEPLLSNLPIGGVSSGDKVEVEAVKTGAAII